MSSEDMRQPDHFFFTSENMDAAKKIMAKYPEGHAQSAIMPLLDLAQRQHGGWLPRVAILYVAELLEMPAVRALEVAHFYSMYNLEATGKYLVQLCQTTPCWLKGGQAIAEACEKHLGIKMGETTQDGLFTLRGVECLGACVNAPVMQINDDYYEDLTPENTVEILKALALGETPKTGSQIGRQGSRACDGTCASCSKEEGA